MSFQGQYDVEKNGATWLFLKKCQFNCNKIEFTFW
jgi:hypothetical protein